MFKSATLLFAAILVGIVVLSVAVRDQLAEKRRLEDEFTATQTALAREGAADLAREWEALEEDGRLVATLGAQIGAANATERADIVPTLRALAIVVRHYRIVTFVPSGEAPPVSAIEPNEKPESARWLTAQSLDVARRLREQGRRRTEGPLASGDGRHALFHATTVGDLGVVVLGVDAQLLFQRAPRLANPDSRYAILDHQEGLWLDCADAVTCTRKPRSEWQPLAPLAGLVQRLRQSDTGAIQMGGGLGKLLGISGETALVAWHAFKAGAATWSFAVVVSPDALRARESGLMRRLVLTSVALVCLIGGIGFVGIRLQRRQAELHERILSMQRQAHLREQSERIINSVPVGIIGIGMDRHLLSANRFVQAKLGPISVGSSVEAAFGDDRRRGAEKLRALVDEAIGLGRRLVLPRPQADALSPQPGQFEVSVVPIADPTEEICALVQVEDFEEIRSLERQLVRAEKLATVGILTAGLAHEIGTPLGIIRVRAETLLESIPAQEEKNLASILGQIDRIAMIIRQLLDFSRAQPVDPGPTDLCAAAKGVGELLGFRLQQKHLHLETVTEQSSLWVAADADQLQQVLVNVVMNACDACPEGGHITLRVARERGASAFVRVEVEDDGCGIPPEHLHTVFDPFFTTKRRGEGTGLGLTVVASIVRNHGGHVSIASEPNRKTTVAISWPAAKQEARTP